MPTLIDAGGKTLRTEPTPAVFEPSEESKAAVIFRAVHREQANRRAGTASTKRRDEVSGGGRKPWKQKGTGRARQGSTRSPQWRHGGVVFGPKPRSYEESLNKKERKVALRAALADRFGHDSVLVLDASSFELVKTKDFANAFYGSRKAAETGPKTLFVYALAEAETVGQNLLRGGANLQRVGILPVTDLEVEAIIAHERLVLTAAAYQALQEVCA
ncbi:MAG TPA: 50S ribosomal protein L4 [Candidatus Dormibacteraeota bacterium]|nr:50S ribosomal protein L4 [Candidatus Dormibacteraeota bacterium]